MNEKILRTRFAPSPTGMMHVGNLRTALYAWLLARHSGGKFILRIEDTDRAREVAGATQVIYRTLEAAGLNHDEGPDNGGDYGPYIQSERKELYPQYAAKLVQQGDAYYCFCDKCEEEEKEGETPSVETCPCRKLDPAVAMARVMAGEPYVVRQKIDRSGVTGFTDSVFGEIQIENKVLDDQILLKRDGYPTYNFANVIDDHLMGINCVVRGSEYLSSTPKYNLLYKAFGWDIPQYVHLPLIMGRDAEGNVSKLSKRHGSVSFENLVQEGYLPQAIINYIALLGWSSKTDREIFTLEELAQAFNVEGLNKSAAVFDYAKLRWMNGEKIKAMTPEEFAAYALPFAKVAGTPLESKWSLIAPLLQGRTELFSEIPEKIAFLLNLPEYGTELFIQKKSKSTPESAKAVLTDLIPEFANLQNWNKDEVNAVITRYAEAHELKLGNPMWAVRIAAAGQMVTPGGAGEILEILGKDETLRRLNLGLAKLN